MLPETLEIGDHITVTYPPVGGIVRTMSGTVESREYAGPIRMLATREGATLVAYGPSVKRTFQHITLHSRRAAEQSPLEGLEL